MKLGVERRLGSMSGELEVDFLAEVAHADLIRQRSGQHDGADPQERPQPGMTHERAAELGQALIGADQLHRL